MHMIWPSFIETHEVEQVLDEIFKKTVTFLSVKKKKGKQFFNFEGLRLLYLVNVTDPASLANYFSATNLHKNQTYCW